MIRKLWMFCMPFAYDSLKCKVLNINLKIFHFIFHTDTLYITFVIQAIHGDPDASAHDAGEAGRNGTGAVGGDAGADLVVPHRPERGTACQYAGVYWRVTRQRPRKWHTLRASGASGTQGAGLWWCRRRSSRPVLPRSRRGIALGGNGY
jgi:hypothetical protein